MSGHGFHGHGFHVLPSEIVEMDECLWKIFTAFFETLQNAVKFSVVIRGHPFSTYAKFSEKRTFLTP